MLCSQGIPNNKPEPRFQAASLRSMVNRLLERNNTIALLSLEFGDQASGLE